MAALTYTPDGDGMLRPAWDIRTAKLLNGKIPNLWGLFSALAHLPLLLARGEVSDILLPETVARMQVMHHDMTVVSLPGIGHAPTLAEPEIVTALHSFLDRVA
jgi:pimeloyl-ACP methyl ester carboxylesterase